MSIPDVTNVTSYKHYNANVAKRIFQIMVNIDKIHSQDFLDYDNKDYRVSNYGKLDLGPEETCASFSLIFSTMMSANVR